MERELHVWERYEKIREDRMRDLEETLRRAPTDLRNLSDEDVRKVLVALWRCKELPAEFN